MLEDGPKKIAYAFVVYGAASSGVFKKICDQVAFWRSSGYSVQLFIITDKNSVKYWREIDQSAEILIDSGSLSKAINRWKLIKLALKSNPQLLYLRDSFPIRIPKTDLPIIIEVQTLVGRELKLRSKTRYLFFSIYKKRYYKKIDGVVYVTNELMQINEFKIKDHVPRISISNGINLQEFQTLPKQQNQVPALFFMGHPNQPWHGVSELVEFARVNQNIEVHIVGESVQISLPNLYSYGRVTRKDIFSIASKCTAGVGSLNLSKIELNEASPLKVREYLALGLPVILRYQDPDLKSTDGFVLQLPSDERTLLHFSIEIQEFLDSWKGKRVSHEFIKSLDVSVKEKARLKYFQEVLSKIPSDTSPEPWVHGDANK